MTIVTLPNSSGRDLPAAELSRSSTANQPDPRVLAMVVCDGIHVDPWTGKRSLLGTFTAVAPPAYPAVVPRMAVYVVLTDMRGSVPITVRVVDVDEDRPPVFDSGPLVVAGPNPVGVVEVDVRVNGPVFPEPGVYLVQVAARGEPLVERRVLFYPAPAPVVPPLPPPATSG